MVPQACMDCAIVHAFFLLGYILCWRYSFSWEILVAVSDFDYMINLDVKESGLPYVPACTEAETEAKTETEAEIEAETETKTEADAQQ